MDGKQEGPKKGALRNSAVLVKTLRLTTTHRYPLTAPWKIRSKPLILCLQVSARWVPPARYRDQLYREPRQDLVARRELHASYSYLGGCRFFTFRRAVSVLWFFLKADCAIDYTPISAMWSCIWRKTARQESHIADRSEVLKDNIKTTLLK